MYCTLTTISTMYGQPSAAAVRRRYLRLCVHHPQRGNSRRKIVLSVAASSMGGGRPSAASCYADTFCLLDFSRKHYTELTITWSTSCLSTWYCGQWNRSCHFCLVTFGVLSTTRHREWHNSDLSGATLLRRPTTQVISGRCSSASTVQLRLNEVKRSAWWGHSGQSDIVFVISYWHNRTDV